jgi:uncharacterized secreted protein with C-terminal beta-propeller domain
MKKLILLSFFTFLFLFGCLGNDFEKFNLLKPTITTNSDLLNTNMTTTLFTNTSIENDSQIQTAFNLSSFQSIPKLKKFSSYIEMYNWIKNTNPTTTGSSSRGLFDFNLAPGSSSLLKALDSSAAKQENQADYSKTNVQVEGIDEPDIVKTDGSYIYYLKQNNLIILRASNENPKIVYNTKLDGDYFLNLFVKDDFLIVFSQTHKESYAIEEFDFQPYKIYTPITNALVFNISDKANPSIIQKLSFYGNFISGRLKDNIVFVVLKDDFSPSPPYPRPFIKENNKLIYPDVYYFENPNPKNSFSTIASFYVNGSLIDSKSFLLNSGEDTVYMSENSLYLAIAKPEPFIPRLLAGYFSGSSQDQINKTHRFEVAILPYLPVNIKNQLTLILKENISDEQKWEKMQPILLDYLKKYEDEKLVSRSELEEFNSMLEKISAALAEYDAKIKIQNSKTFIYKFSIKNGSINYLSSNFVNGKLLNQWSLDEDNDYLRVATTIDIWTRKNILFNNIFVFDKDLNLVGKLEQIAPDEKIYSVRFMQNRAYLVTYKKIDPFFVVDLSSPENPKVLGYLKIPGYSTYLHPYNSSVIIGLGVNTLLSEYGFEMQKGIKLALFDVSDPAKPKLLDSWEVGDEGTTSPALTDHKAFVFDKNKSILYLPIKLVQKSSSLFYDKKKTSFGVYVLNLSDAKINPIGQIEHYSYSDIFNYFEQDYFINRVLYISNLIFSFSNKYIFINDLNKNLSLVKSFEI